MTFGQLTRRLRRSITLIVMLGFALAQVAVASHASCRMGAAHEQHRSQASAAEPALVQVDAADAESERAHDPVGSAGDGHCCDIHCKVGGAVLGLATTASFEVSTAKPSWFTRLAIRNVVTSLDRPPKTTAV